MEKKIYYKIFSIFFVLVIAVICGTFFLNQRMETEKENDTITKMLQIQAEINLIQGVKSTGEASETKYFGTKFIEIHDENIKEKINGLNLSQEELEKFYLLSQEDLAQMGLSEGSSDNKYGVCYENGEVIYLDGVKIDGQVIKRLSEIN